MAGDIWPEEESKEQVDVSHLTKYGCLQGDYLLDFSQGEGERKQR